MSTTTIDDADSMMNDDDVRNGGNDRTPTLPKTEGIFEADVKKWHTVNAKMKGKIRFAEILITKSSNDLVLVGERYVFMWFLEHHSKGPGVAKKAAAKGMHPFLAACAGEDPKSKDFDAAATSQLLLTSTAAAVEKGEELEGIRIRIRRVIENDRDGTLDQQGKVKSYARDTFSTVAAA